MLLPKYQIRRVTAFSSLSCCLFFSQAGADFDPPEFLETRAGCPSHVGNGSHGARADAPPPPPSPPPPPPAPLIAIFQALGECLPPWPLLDVSLCCPMQRQVGTQLTVAPWQAHVPGLHSVPWWAQSQPLHGHDQGTEGGGTHGTGVILLLLFLSLLLAHAFLSGHHWKGPCCCPLQRWAAIRLTARALLPSTPSSRASEQGGQGGPAAMVPQHSGHW